MPRKTEDENENEDEDEIGSSVSAWQSSFNVFCSGKDQDLRRRSFNRGAIPIDLL
jgi:hypothetical protein